MIFTFFPALRMQQHQELAHESIVLKQANPTSGFQNFAFIPSSYVLNLSNCIFIPSGVVGREGDSS